MTEIITPEMEEIRAMIVNTVAKRNELKSQMEAHFKEHPNKRFEQMHRLITVDATLSELDSHYKRLWDHHNAKELS